jgi:hypothetical protein
MEKCEEEGCGQEGDLCAKKVTVFQQRIQQLQLPLRGNE